MFKKICIAVGALVLAAAGAFAGRISHKENGDAIDLYSKTPSPTSSCTLVATVLSISFTTGGLGQQAYFNWVGGIHYYLFATSGFKPGSVVHFHN